MKKASFLIFLTVAVLLVPAMSFAADTDIKEATDKTLAALETPPSSISKELQKDDFAASGATNVPVATVSDVEKKESQVSTVNDEAAQAKGTSSKASSVVSSEKKATVASKKTEASSALNPEDLQRRWKVLFSKEVDADSILYTVKPGDSLYVLARKNHTTVDFIKKLNGLKSDNIYPRMKLKIHTAPFSIQVDKSKNILVLYSNGEAVKKYSVATGKKNCTPVGEFKITDKLVHPTWFKTGAILPPGSPENALGTRWMGFDKPAYGIHGTIEPKSIGTQASEGCIRMLNEDVEELYSLVPVGTKVTIQD
ncbi:MAG: L,D-transpeptidase family protein [Candidatus Omnitrophica bacterium]|nr:L,D-transpeptidase family protein [Candidatus Omnitrophota bacterium]